MLKSDIWLVNSFVHAVSSCSHIQSNELHPSTQQKVWDYNLAKGGATNLQIISSVTLNGLYMLPLSVQPL